MFGRRKAAWLVVGLGNPGPKYANTRHNAGAMLVSAVAKSESLILKRERHGMRVAETLIGTSNVTLGSPTSFMNVSGTPVARLAKKTSVKPSQIVVAHDELDLPFGVLRLKVGGGTGGHNGIASIATSLRSKDFLRLRIGIGRPPAGVDPVDFVLQRFTNDEAEILDKILDLGASALLELCSNGVDAAHRALTNP